MILAGVFISPFVGFGRFWGLEGFVVWKVLGSGRFWGGGRGFIPKKVENHLFS